MQRYTMLLVSILVLVVGAVFLAPTLWQLVYPYAYREIIEENARANGLDPLLVAAVIRVESSFRKNALSPKGARGLMQIMPATGHWVAEQIGRHDFNEEQLFEPAINVKLGTWYLRNLHDQFDGRLAVVLAAYNGGRGNVRNWLYEKTWSGQIDDIAQIPFPETRHYVWRVLRVYNIYRGLYAR
ncbi:MAG: Soluble lytic murein transglycosylase [Firmicutes bacterium]|nr:Soluble lytic murein transglycosylase [Bacillota bacterium]MBT9157207.1 Soluble lytic murein transglycosylase [Bacillota bacterium]